MPEVDVSEVLESLEKHTTPAGNISGVVSSLDLVPLGGARRKLMCRKREISISDGYLV